MCFKENEYHCDHLATRGAKALVQTARSASLHVSYSSLLGSPEEHFAGLLRSNVICLKIIGTERIVHNENQVTGNPSKEHRSSMYYMHPVEQVWAEDVYLMLFILKVSRQNKQSLEETSFNGKTNGGENFGYRLRSL